VVDALVVIGFGLAIARPARVDGPPPPLPIASSAVASSTPKKERPDAGPRPRAVTIWNGVDAADLGKRVGALYLSVRKNLGKAKKVLLQPPRRVGDDVEIHVSVSRNGLGWPPSMYCFHCAAQKCLFADPTQQALETLANAFPADEVKELAAKVGRDHVQLAYVGGASAGPVVTKSEADVCEDGTKQTIMRFPSDYDTYDDSECGAHVCELSGSGEQVQVTAGRIDDNKKLACLRAFCLKAGATAGDLGDVPVKFIGELAFEQGTAYRGAEVVFTLRSIGVNKDAYAAFWEQLSQTLADKP
jgi:hypothetical protein